MKSPKLFLFTFPEPAVFASLAADKFVAAEAEADAEAVALFFQIAALAASCSASCLRCVGVIFLVLGSSLADASALERLPPLEVVSFPASRPVSVELVQRFAASFMRFMSSDELIQAP